MAQSDTQKQQSGKPDTAEYSASKAPETRQEAEEHEPTADPRLTPGGRHGSKVEIGMSALDRDAVPSAAGNPHQTDYGSSPQGHE